VLSYQNGLTTLTINTEIQSAERQYLVNVSIIGDNGIHPSSHNISANGMIGARIQHTGSILVLDLVGKDVLAHFPVHRLVADEVVTNVLKQMPIMIIYNKVKTKATKKPDVPSNQSCR
jgi:hypothetical protein